MVKFVSTKGGSAPVDFETAILDGYASDEGLYVPDQLPSIGLDQLRQWRGLGFKELAFEVLSLFIDRSIISSSELKGILDLAYSQFEKDEVIPLHKLKSRQDTYIMELFYGPTLSFKDIGQAFLVNLFDFFLKRRKEHLSIIVATTGDTGPAAASFIAGKSTMDAWVLYPKGFITEEQERQMTTLYDSNIHPVGVYDCPEGGDDLDYVIHKLYANKEFKERVNLSSVNSINWGRIMMQSVHYFYGYLQVVDTVGEEINMAVPSGGFGNLCAGGIARKMGLPIKTFVVSNNKNANLHRIFSQGMSSKEDIHETVSNAMDILFPYNFWRFLYFCLDNVDYKIRDWLAEYEKMGSVNFDEATYKSYSKGFLSNSVTDAKTLATMKVVYDAENYVLDPHGAVALASADKLKDQLDDLKMICLATAHPAKFPKTILRALESDTLPGSGMHHSIERAKTLCQKGYTCNNDHLEEALMAVMDPNSNSLK